MDATVCRLCHVLLESTNSPCSLADALVVRYDSPRLHVNLNHRAISSPRRVHSKFHPPTVNLRL